MSTPGRALIGRAHEIEVGLGVLGDSVFSAGRVVYLGGPGVGKSAVLKALAEAAERSGVLVLRAGGIPSESDVPFATLGQLLRPALADIDELPVAQQRVLDRVLRVGAAGAQAGPRTAAAVLALVELLGREHAIALVVDDAQWVDRATMDVLGFVHRRAHGVRLAMVFASREADGVELPDVTTVPLAPLASADAAAVLDMAAPDLDPTHRQSILDAAQGNPLALVELARAVRNAPGLVDETLPLTARLRQSFAGRLGDLPAQSRALLLLCAYLDSGDMADLAAAAEAAGIDLAALDAAVMTHLIRTDGQTVRFPHPMIASVVIDTAAPSERRASHQVLARALARYPARALRHRAEAAIGPDEGLAAALEREAVTMTGAGTAAAKARMLERAAALGDDGRAAACRLAAAANSARAAGRYGHAQSLLARIDPDAVDASIRLNIETQNSWHEFDVGNVDTALAHLVAALADAHDLGFDQTTRPAAVAAVARWLSGDFSYDATLRRVLAGLDVAMDEAAIPALALMTLAAADSTERPNQVLRLLEDAALHIDNQGPAPPGTTDIGDMRAWQIARLADAALIIDAVEPARVLARQASEQLRWQGSFGALATALATSSHAEFSAGDWTSAATLAREVLDICAVTGQQRQAAFARANLTFIAAAQGRSLEADGWRRELLAWATPRRQRLIGALAAWTQLTSALADGETDIAASAAAAIQAGDDDTERGRLYVVSSCADVIEALVRVGSNARAVEVLAWVDTPVQRWNTPTLAAHAAHAHAVFAEHDGADAVEVSARYQRALSIVEICGPFTLARARLHYGTWLRRNRRPRHARTYLAGAEDLFAGLGAIPWVARAQAELRASGQPRPNVRPLAPAPAVPVSAPDETGVPEALTGQELAIVELAAAGLSNRQIGERMFLSPRTVGSHLYRAFPKLGVSNRAQLRAALDRRNWHDT